MSDSKHSIAGGWLGTYHYRGVQTGRPPVRFEATFSVTDAGRFAGTVLDDGGGEAQAAGVQTGRTVAFTKTYRGHRRGYAFPVEYEGKLSKNGKTMRGTWHIRAARGMPAAQGVWDARRLWVEQSHGEQDIAEEAVSRQREMTV